VLFGLGYLGSLPGVTLAVAGEMMEHGHEHQVELVQHGGHVDLVFHHHEQEHEEKEEQDHRCHMLELPSHAPATLVQLAGVQIQAVSDFTVAPSEPPVFVAWADAGVTRLARPPPDPRSGTLACLRTIVLRV
jgi:hypothetical protein